MRRRPTRQFYFRLAAHLGMTVGELLARVSSRELTEWMVYERVAGPLGGRRGDIQSAIIAATIVNSKRGKGKKAVQPADFMPTFDDFQSDDDMWAAIRETNEALGGTVREPD